VEERNISLSPAISHLMLAFSLEELAGLTELIIQADSALEIQRIIRKD
jgi:hypothetical protein